MNPTDAQTPEEESEDAPEIANRAFAALNEGDLETAQALATQLEKLHYSAYFEIQALIYQKQDNPTAAIKILREGVSKAAAAWPLWQLLGNSLSDAGDFEGALDSYAHGLELDLSDKSRASLHYNRAMVFQRKGQIKAAQDALAQIPDEVLAEDTSFWRYVEGLRLRVLARLGDCAQVFERADTLEIEMRDVASDDVESLAVFWSQGGQALAECGEIERAHQWALEALRANRTDEQALSLLRETSTGLPQASRYFQVLLEGDFKDEDDNDLGFYTSFLVVARIAEEAEQLALAMEAPRWDTPLHVSECQFEGECELQPIGVFDVGSYCFFPRDGQEDEPDEQEV